MQQQLLRIVASGQPIASMGDSFFVTLQREPFPLARSREEQVQRWNETREFGQHIVRTEISSRNLSTLMVRLTTLLETLAANHDPLDQFRGTVDLELPNLTLVVTIFTHHLVAAPHRDLVRYFPDSDMLSRLFCAICTTIAKLPVSHDTVCFYEDLLELLICLLSEQLTDRFDDPFPYSPGGGHSPTSPPYLCSIFTCACSQELILGCLARLLSNIGQGPAPPPPPPTSAYPPTTPLTAMAVPLSATGSTPSGGLFGAISGLFASRPPADLTRVAELSSYLLGLIASQRELMQPWTSTLLGVQDSIRSGSTLNLVAEGSKLTFPFKRLLGVLQDRIAIPQYAVLLYAFVYKNDAFLEYVLAQMDPDRLIVPILRFIFVACLSTYTPSNAPPIPPIPPNPPAVPYSHIYILSITLLILTSDTSYLETLMTVTCPSGVPDWLNDRRASLSPSMSLGSLMALVVMRIMQANLAADRDQYLHANCVAILANLSRSWRGMHAVVALRLVNWVEVVARRYARLKMMAARSTRGGGEVGLGTVTGGADSDVGSAPQTPGTARRGSMIEHAVLDPSTDLAIYAELVTFLLDIIRSVLHPTQLRFNPHLIADLSKTFHPVDSTLPTLRFQYSEDVDTSAFFVPFVWRAIYLASPYLAWDPMQPGVFEDDELPSPRDESVGLGLHDMSSMSLSWMGSGSLNASSRSLAASMVAMQPSSP
ncbi:Dyggve-Melchior-Clausen syndrome protein-domain-containing protein [Catenaria anguillulae PL171]|uniref:Dymeclin n=1 Tax=Catenaria anguillulae PL171 TaxID=765915 RepID=A0A1Y2HFB9_9FUNG|nr:Dyggve-Melchior-Clausen syndrome protein-domain-containing protein [Catenaria anguillulae PL171]